MMITRPPQIEEEDTRKTLKDTSFRVLISLVRMNENTDNLLIISTGRTICKVQKSE